MTDREIRLARAVSAVAAEAGLTIACTGISRLELALDSPQYTAVLPVLGGRAQGGAERHRDTRPG